MAGLLRKWCLMSWMGRFWLCYNHSWSHPIPSRPNHCWLSPVPRHRWLSPAPDLLHCEWSCPVSIFLPPKPIISSALSLLSPFSPSTPPAVPLSCTDQPEAFQSSALPWLVNPTALSQPSRPRIPPRPNDPLAPPWTAIPQAPLGPVVPLATPWSIVALALPQISRSTATPQRLFLSSSSAMILTPTVST